MRVTAAALALLAAWASPAGGQSMKSKPAPGTPASPFPVGERLLYEVIFGFLRLGTAEMRVVGIDTVRGKPAVHVRFVIQGSNYLYRLNNSMDSWISLADTSSLRFRQDNDENGKIRHAAYEIFPDSGYYRQLGVDSLKDKRQPTSPKPLDDAAFFYFVRTTQLEPGKRYEVILDSLVRDTLDVPAGKYPTIKLKPVIPGGKGILAEASNARMWLSDDDRKIMVQLKSKFPFGVITMRLAKGQDKR